MEKNYLYEDELSNSPLPEILATIEKYKVAGVIIVKDEKFERKIYLNEGKIIFATSTNPDERLGEFLLYKGIITKEQYDESVVRLKRGEGRQGKILVDMKVLTPKELFLYVQEQIAEIVYNLFNLNEGKVLFQIGKFKEEEIIKLSIPIKKAIFEGIKKIKDPKRCFQRLGSKTAVYEPIFELKDILGLSLTPEETKLLQMVDGRKNLYEIITKGPFTQGMNARILYAFFVLHLISKKSDGFIKIQWKTEGDQFF